MNKTYTKAERAHLAAVKNLPCSVCGASGPSEAHHIDQGNAYSCVALCVSCHRDEHNGIHGRKAMWKVMRMNEVGALCKTFCALLHGVK